MNVACIVKRFEHHSASAGYDRLAEYVGARRFRRPDTTRFPVRIFDAFWHAVGAPGIRRASYSGADLLAELRALTGCGFAAPDLLHVLYGDEQLYFLLRARRFLRCPLVASFHLPAASKKAAMMRQEDGHLMGRGLDAAIVVARSEIATYRDLLGEGKVYFHPHGIDVERFCPPRSPRTNGGRLKLLTVGDHKRDFESIHRTMDLCAARGLPVDLTAVVRPLFRGYFAGCDNVRVLSKIPETELVALYQEADALFLPVREATANNAALEALACGLPVISTKVGGMVDYVDDTCGWLVDPQTPHEYLNLIGAICANRNLVRAKEVPARLMAESFAWDKVVALLREIYAEVLARGRSDPDRPNAISRR